MKEKFTKEIARIGTDTVDHGQLTVIEAVSMSVVAILALTIGTIYGDKLL